LKEITLPSGAILQITPAPFADAKALYQAMMAEARGVELQSRAQFMDIAKNLICIGFSSRAIDAALTKCMARCTYNTHRIDEKTFEPLEARQDYTMVCMEVLEETIRPFSKNLSAVFSRLLSTIGENLQ
jgi:hypothetical protein